MTKEEYVLHQWVKVWNIVATFLFIVLIFVLYFLFQVFRPEEINFIYLDIPVLVLAIFRLVRLFIYDNITLFLREMFMDLQVRDGIYSFVVSKNSFKHTMHKLLNCPWCFGVWLTFVSVFFYYTFPMFKIVFFILAISSLVSLLVLVSNLLGWSAEEKKLKVQKM